MFDLMHTPGILGRVKRFAIKYNLIELSDLIGFGYDLSDTQDGLKVLWLTSSPPDKNSGG